MSYSKALLGTSTFVVLMGSAASADVTPADVWANWQNAAASMGQTITAGSQSQSGGTLTISDLSMSVSAPEITVTATLPELSFQDNGDGTVAISMTPSYTMNVVIDADGDEGMLDVNVSTAGMAMNASGDPSEITYQFVASSMDINVDGLTADGQKINLTVDAGISNLAGTYLVAGGDNPQVDTNLIADNFNLAVAMSEPGGGDGRFAMNLDYADVEAESSGSLFGMADIEQLSTMLANGASTSTTLSHGASTVMVDFLDGRDMFKLDATSSAGGFDLSFDADALAYGISNQDLAFAMQASDIPLPVEASFGELGFELLVPVSKTDQPQDFGLSIILGDLAVSDMIWGMIDAGGALPHDPATLVVDVSGQANWLMDILNPMSEDNMNVMMPGEVHALDINEVLLSIAGAELTGAGSFTFDNANLMTFDGIPAPTGSLDLQLVGGNGLMDKLVDMGLLPEEQAMGARMMMGLFARPGDGTDTLVSTIEVDSESGAVSANGQRLQ